MGFEIFEQLREAFGRSTLSDNKFERFLNSYSWDAAFYADDDEEWQFLKNFSNGSWIMFSVKSKNPFDCKLRPSAIFSDGSYIEI